MLQLECPEGCIRTDNDVGGAAEFDVLQNALEAVKPSWAFLFIYLKKFF